VIHEAINGMPKRQGFSNTYYIFIKLVINVRTSLPAAINQFCIFLYSLSAIGIAELLRHKHIRIRQGSILFPKSWTSLLTKNRLNHVGPLTMCPLWVIFFPANGVMIPYDVTEILRFCGFGWKMPLS